MQFALSGTGYMYEQFGNAHAYMHFLLFRLFQYMCIQGTVLQFKFNVVTRRPVTLLVFTTLPLNIPNHFILQPIPCEGKSIVHSIWCTVLPPL